MAWHFFQRKTDLFDGLPKTMLHIAPEECLSNLLQRVPKLEYLTADMLDPSAMIQMDITDIQYPDHSFDVIYCSHVLEHVSDDHKAMCELHRVLKPTGWAAIVVPMTGKATYEDPSVTDPKERERLFGQADHVRIYGPDFKDRLIRAGFAVDAFRAVDLYNRKDMALYAVPDSETPIFRCTLSE